MAEETDMKKTPSSVGQLSRNIKSSFKVMPIEEVREVFNEFYLEGAPKSELCRFWRNELHRIAPGNTNFRLIVPETISVYILKELISQHFLYKLSMEDMIGYFVYAIRKWEWIVDGIAGYLGCKTNDLITLKEKGRERGHAEISN